MDLPNFTYALKYMRTMGRRKWRKFRPKPERKTEAVFHILLWTAKLCLLYVQYGSLNEFLNIQSTHGQSRVEIVVEAAWFALLLPFIYSNATLMAFAYLLIASLSRTSAVLAWSSRIPYMRRSGLQRYLALRRNQLLSILFFYVGDWFRNQDIADVALEHLQWSESFLRATRQQYENAWSPRWQRLLSGVCFRIGNTYDQLGDRERAGRHFDVAWQESSPFKLAYGWRTPNHDLGDTELLVHCNNILALIDSLRESGRLTTEQRELGARIYTKRAEANYSMGNVDDALVDCQCAITELHRIDSAECHALADAYIAKVRIRVAKNDLHGAISDIVNITDIYGRYDAHSASHIGPGMNYAHLVSRLGIYSEISSLFTEFAEFKNWIRSWSTQISKQICLECTNILFSTTRSSSDSRATRLRSLYRSFHQDWLRHAMVHDIDIIPNIILAVQGRELAQEVANEYRDKWAASGRVTTRGIWGESRGMGLREFFSIRGGHAGGGGGGGAVDSVFRGAYQSVTKDDLQQLLAEDEMLVLLVECRVGGRNLYGAYCLAKSGTSTLVALGDLSRAVNDLVEFGRLYAVKGNIGNEVHGYQRAHFSSFWEEMGETTDWELWRHLGRITDGARKLVVVTQGSLHMLPVEVGKPEGISVVIYPGLIYFLHQRRRGGESSRGKFGHTRVLGTRYYSGDDGKLLLAKKECEMIGNLLTKDLGTVNVEKQVNFEGIYGACALLLICCHNGAEGDSPNSYSLKIGKGKSLDAKAIRNMGLRATAVIASTCLGGVIKEDHDGNPIGLFTGFWLRGTQILVASRVPVADEWMPVLSLLTFQALSREVDTLEVALEVAKRRLCSGDWYEDTEEFLRSHVLETWKSNLYIYYTKVLNKDSSKHREMCACFVEQICDYARVSESERGIVVDRYVSQSDREERCRMIAELCDLFAEERLRRRVPPEPVRGILMYAVSAFGESKYLVAGR